MIDSSVVGYNLPVLILNSGKYIVHGGFWNGSIQINPVGKEKVVQYQHHHSTVTALVSDSSNKIIISGYKSNILTLN